MKLSVGICVLLYFSFCVFFENFRNERLNEIVEIISVGFFVKFFI